MDHSMSSADNSPSTVHIYSRSHRKGEDDKHDDEKPTDIFVITSSFNGSTGIQKDRQDIEISSDFIQKDMQDIEISSDLSTEEGEVKKSHIFKMMTGRQKTTFVLLAIVQVLSGAGFYLFAPFFPQEASKKGVSDTVIGLIFSSFQLIIFLSSPILGKYITKIGPKVMFVTSILVGGSFSVIFGLLHYCPPGPAFVILCFICRSVEALGIAGLLTASFTIISNEFPKNVAFVIGSLETASGVGLMIGPTVGGVLYEVGGFGLPFFTIGGLIFLNGFVIFQFLPAYQEVVQQKNQGFLKLLKSLQIWVYLIVITITSIGISFVDPTLSKHLETFHLSSALIGVVFSITPFMFGLTAPLWGYLCDSKGYTFSLLILGSIACGVSFLIAGPTPYLEFLPRQLWMVVLGLGVLGLGIACATIPIIKCMIHAAYELDFEDNMDTYGLVAGLYNSVWSLGGFIGPTAGSVLVSQLGDFSKASSVISLLFIFSTLCVVLCSCIEKLRSSVKFSLEAVNDTRKGRITDIAVTSFTSTDEELCNNNFVKDNNSPKDPRTACNNMKIT